MAFSQKTKTRDKTTAGITISTDGIALALVTHSRKSPSLVHAEFYPVTKDEQNTVLSQLAKKHRLANRYCNFVLTPEEYQLHQVATPDVPKQELGAAIRWRIKDLIDFHIDDAVIDVIDIPNQDATNTKSTEVVACRQSVIQSYVDLLLGAKCQLQTIDIAELATKNILTQLNESEPSIGLLSLWPTYSRISIYSNNDLYLSRSSNIGTEDLVKNDSRDENNPFILDSLALELQRTFDYYESHSRQTPIQKLLIVSHDNLMPDIAESLQQRLGTHSQYIDFSTVGLKVSASINQQDMLSRCFLAIGAALRTEQ